MRKLSVIAAVTALLAAAAGVGYSAIPSGDGTISACKDNKGVLRAIDAEAGQSCGHNQQLVTWNQQGPAGPQGEPGISGYEVVTAQSGHTDQPLKEVTATCPDGKVPVGGGGRAFMDPWADGEYSNVALSIQRSERVGNAWVVIGVIADADEWALRAQAICAAAG